MPVSSRVITAAGTTFAMSQTLPATHDIAGFEALTFTNIGEIVDGGSAGKTFNKVDHSPLSEREVLSLKGSFTQGIRTLTLGRDVVDAGQLLIIDQLDIDTAAAFSITYQNGDIDYITATVDSYTSDIGTIDSIVGATTALAQCQVTIRTLVSGVATASVNAGGTVTIADGNYPATQTSTSGVGVAAEFTITIATNVVTAVVSVDKTGSGYIVADTITINVTGAVNTVPAVLDVDTIY